MNFRLNKAAALSVVALGFCALLGGCSHNSYHAKYELPDYVEYSSVYLTLNVNDQAFNKLDNVNATNIYAYNSSGARVSATTGVFNPKVVDGRYKFNFFCNAKATTITLDYIDANGDFAGCSTVTLPEMGKKYSEVIDVDKIYDKTSAPKSYSLNIKELASEKKQGGTINLEAVLKTPCGEQYVTDNIGYIDWSSSDVGVLYSLGSGTYKVMASGKADAIVEYNTIFSATKKYIIP